jgi:formylglycine-generating enzyme required for sulfatase activity
MLLRLSLILLCLYFAVSPADARRVALVMGNSNYRSFNVLPNPVNDAKLMNAALLAAGFEVTLMLDSDQAQMKRAVLEFGRVLRKGVDASMFYYAGHGVQVKGENYLIPVDADLQSEDEVGVQTIDVNAFLDTMESAKSPFNIVVFDACRNNPLSSSRGKDGGLAPVTAPKGSFVAYSTAPGKVAQDGNGVPNSPYTAALAETLATPGMKLEDVFKKTRELVLASTDGAQVPFESTSITGDFYFTDAPVIAPVMVAPVIAVEDPIKADFTTARSIGTVASWDVFLQNHGTTADLLVELAKQERDKLALLDAPPPEVEVPKLQAKKPTEVPPEFDLGEACEGISVATADGPKCLKPGDQFTECENCPDMVVVPTGNFLMGSPKEEKNRQEDEGLRHRVIFRSPFAVGKFEITFGQFQNFLADTKYKRNSFCKSKAGVLTQPIDCVSWSDAQAYVKWLSKVTDANYRLLTESEWEYAARGGTTTTYFTGKTITTTQANFDGLKRGTMVIGSYTANGFGLHDMAGNVWEWTQDCYVDRYRNDDASGNAVEGTSCGRVIRGGAWDSDSKSLRSSDRNGDTPNNRASNIGFRVARSLQ